MTRRMIFFRRSKEQLRKRFMKEYVHALEERQEHSTGNAERNVPKTGGGDAER